MSEETTRNEITTPEKVEMRDYETLLKVGPKKMTEEELCFMVNRLKKEKEQFEVQAKQYAENCEKAYAMARESESKLEGITRGLNAQYDFILRQAQLMRDAINLSIKGEF